ncbi:MAG: FtsX-like permease family protein [Sarcina sp.]
MRFTSIIKKNFQFNFNKFLSFFLGNTAVIALMIMYSSLIFNGSLKKAVDGQSIEKVILVGLLGLIVFCLVFITYTNIVFLKNRGKEFGMYLTLGMTTKELTKIVAFENFMVMVVSIISGAISGSLFGRLFYMGLNKVLQISNVKYELNISCFALSIGVFIIIFLFNILFNFIYLKRVSVIKILKSEKSKEISKERPTIVFIALVLFIIAMIVTPKVLLSGKENLGFVAGIAIGITILAPYILIGGGISFIKAVIKKKPSLYNKNILVISNLNHRFNSYKNMLYMLTILIAGSLFFVGYSYSAYKSTKVVVDEKLTFDLSFDTDNKFNQISKNDTEAILKNNGGSIENYYRIPYVTFGAIHKTSDEIYEYWSSRSTFISESAYNSYMDDKLNLDGNSVVYLHVHNELMERKKYDEYILVNITEEKREEINKFFEEKDDYTFNELEYKDVLGSEFQVSVDSYKEIGGAKFSNDQSAYVVSDELYNKMKKECNLKEYYINLINGKNLENGYNALKQELKIRNGFDSSYWSGKDLFREEDSYEKESAIPIYKEFEFDRMIKQNGILYFILVFIGLLFLGANGIVLYYKVISDVDEEVERIKSLERIGTTTSEIKRILSKEMAIIFFVPIFMGGIMGYYYLMLMSSNIGSTTLKNVLVSGFLSVLFVGVVMQIIFYFISRKKYFKEIFRKN